jgi:hypothetical protein
MPIPRSLFKHELKVKTQEDIVPRTNEVLANAYGQLYSSSLFVNFAMQGLVG